MQDSPKDVDWSQYELPDCPYPEGGDPLHWMKTRPDGSPRCDCACWNEPVVLLMFLGTSHRLCSLICARNVIKLELEGLLHQKRKVEQLERLIGAPGPGRLRKKLGGAVV